MDKDTNIGGTVQAVLMSCHSLFRSIMWAQKDEKVHTDVSDWRMMPLLRFIIIQVNESNSLKFLTNHCCLKGKPYDLEEVFCDLPARIMHTGPTTFKTKELLRFIKLKR